MLRNQKEKRKKIVTFVIISDKRILFTSWYQKKERAPLIRISEKQQKKASDLCAEYFVDQKNTATKWHLTRNKENNLKEMFLKLARVRSMCKPRENNVKLVQSYKMKGFKKECIYCPKEQDLKRSSQWATYSYLFASTFKS